MSAAATTVAATFSAARSTSRALTLRLVRGVVTLARFWLRLVRGLSVSARLLRLLFFARTGFRAVVRFWAAVRFWSEVCFRFEIRLSAIRAARRFCGAGVGLRFWLAVVVLSALVAVDVVPLLFDVRAILMDVASVFVHVRPVGMNGLFSTANILQSGLDLGFVRGGVFGM